MKREENKGGGVQYRAMAVKLPGYDHLLFFVVVKGFGMEPMMLLSSCEVNLPPKSMQESGYLLLFRTPGKIWI